MVARIPLPPTIVSFDFTEEKTPAVARRCRGCGGIFLPLDDTIQPPASYAEAWKPPVLCRGTIDPELWRWCKVSGDLVLPHRMRVVFFPDRRLVPRLT